MTTNLLIWFVFAGCLALSFLLSGMEAGVFALSRMRIRQRMRAGQRSAELLHGYLENPENFLWTLFVGNTVANFAILGIAIVALHDLVGDRRLWFALFFGLFVFLFYTFFDLLPKMLFRMHPNRLCLASARPFRIIHLALRPLVSLVQAASAALLLWTRGKAFRGRLFGNREELRWVMQESAGAFSTEERAMINHVLDLQSLTVRQVARPLDQAATVTRDTPVKQVLAVSRERRVSRLPVWETRGDRRRVVGLLAIDDILYQPSPGPLQAAGEYVRPALYVDEDVRLEVALRRMQRAGQRLAVVLDRAQQEAGIVSLEDILKVIFGEVKL